MSTPRRRISADIRTGKKTGRQTSKKAVKKTLIPSTLRRGINSKKGY